MNMQVFFSSPLFQLVIYNWDHTLQIILLHDFKKYSIHIIMPLSNLWKHEFSTQSSVHPNDGYYIITGHLGLISWPHPLSLFCFHNTEKNIYYESLLFWDLMNLDYLLFNVLWKVCTNLYFYHKGMRIFCYIHANIGWLFVTMLF